MLLVIILTCVDGELKLGAVPEPTDFYKMLVSLLPIGSWKTYQNPRSLVAGEDYVRLIVSSHTFGGMVHDVLRHL